MRYRRVRLEFDTTFEPVGIMPVVEVLDWAQREVADLLGGGRPDTLRVINSTDIPDYLERTGYGFHRLYRRQGSVAIIEPANVLFARGLALHAAFHLMTVWQLDDLTGTQELPRWFSEGLASYLAEDGTHYLSYLGHVPVRWGR